MFAPLDRYSQDDVEDDASRVAPCIVHMDSLPGCHDATLVATRLRKYLVREWEQRKSKNPLRR